MQVAWRDALRSQAELTLQRNFDHIFVSMLTYDGTSKEGFFKCATILETACLQSGRDNCTEVLGKVGGGVRTCLMGLPLNLLWSSV